MAPTQIHMEISLPAIATFCKKWQIREFALFGSVLREDFRPDSDVDVLVTFVKHAPWSLFDFVNMESELEVLFGREVDFVSKRGIEASRNYLRRKSILDSARVIYGAR